MNVLSASGQEGFPAKKSPFDDVNRSWGLGRNGWGATVLGVLGGDPWGARPAFLHMQQTAVPEGCEGQLSERAVTDGYCGRPREVT
jgi:hypothetical protein